MNTEKELIEKYPFLQPRNVWTDEIPDNYDYNYCLLKDEIPPGWWERFGIAYCEDLKDILNKYNYLNEFRFVQCKEKYGGLRAYNNGAPEEWNAHEHAWEYISEHTCVKCGEFPVPMRFYWWISPYCDYHAFELSAGNKKEIDVVTEKKWDGRLNEYLVISRYSKDGDNEEWIDMKPFYDKIGWKYTDKDLILKDEIKEIIENRKKKNK